MDRMDYLGREGQAKAFRDWYRASHRYDAHEKRWMAYEATRWVEDLDDRRARRAAYSTLRSLNKEDPSNHAIAELLERVRSFPDMVAAPEEWDARYELFNTLSGVVNLLTGEVLPHDPALMLTQIAGVGVEPGGECPDWWSLLRWQCDETDPEEPLLKYYLRVMGGECLSVRKRRQKLVLMQGWGNNGKSTFLAAIRHMMGSYATNAAPGLIEDHKQEQHPADVADLKGVRLAIITETTPGCKADIAKIKRLTGEEILKSRGMGANWSEFRRCFSLVGGCNDLPELNGGGLGDWRRMEVWPWHQVVESVQIDPELVDKLKAQAGAFLDHLIAHGKAYHTERLNIPKQVEKATNAYRSAHDSLQPFIERCCVTGEGMEQQSRPLWESHTAWASSLGMPTLSEPEFSKRLKKGWGFKKEKRKAASYWLGMSLRPLNERIEEEDED